MMDIDNEALRAADPQDIYIEALAVYGYMMNPEEVAEFLGQSRQAVTNFLRCGELRGIKSGSSWRVPKKCLIEFMYANANRD